MTFLSSIYLKALAPFRFLFVVNILLVIWYFLYCKTIPESHVAAAKGVSLLVFYLFAGVPFIMVDLFLIFTIFVIQKNRKIPLICFFAKPWPFNRYVDIPLLAIGAMAVCLVFFETLRIIATVIAAYFYTKIYFPNST
ncbi:MAG: hypothetical protein IPK79_08310 [Vampirovibrionales bacterium]|nr:hypothetical protein [Vampirovibrionales bacterium]